VDSSFSTGYFHHAFLYRPLGHINDAVQGERLNKGLSVLFFIPSFYGFGTWGIALGLYQLRIMGWDPSTTIGTSVFVSTWAAFAFSTLVVVPVYSKAVRRTFMPIALTPSEAKGRSAGDVKDVTLLGLHIIGFFGLGVYLVQIQSMLGGFSAFVNALTSESYLIRGAGVEPIGIYFSYFGWIAIPLTLLRWKLRGRLDRVFFLALLMQIAGNLLFIDRTRPIWLGFISVLMMLPFLQTLSFWRIARTVLFFLAFGLLAFNLIALWVGKTAEGLSTYGYVGVGLQTAALYNYITGGFAYFESVLEFTSSIDYVPQRILYPFFKMLAIFGLAADPPSQVLPFLTVPFPVNVGTFLEPYYSDGGFLYLVLGVLFSTLGVNFIALFFLRAANPFTLFVWANLCFASFIGFFVPKLVSTPIWLFVFVALVSVVIGTILKTLGHSSSTEPTEKIIGEVVAAGDRPR
jgi:hypothetical protein